MAERRNHRRLVLSFSLYHGTRAQDYSVLMSYNLFHLFWLPIDGVIGKRKGSSELETQQETRKPFVQHNGLVQHNHARAAAWGCSTISQCPLCWAEQRRIHHASPCWASAPPQKTHSISPSSTTCPIDQLILCGIHPQPRQTILKATLHGSTLDFSLLPSKIQSMYMSEPASHFNGKRGFHRIEVSNPFVALLPPLPPLPPPPAAPFTLISQPPSPSLLG